MYVCMEECDCDITDVTDICLVYVCMEGWDYDITDVTDMCLVYVCMGVWKEAVVTLHIKGSVPCGLRFTTCCFI